MPVDIATVKKIAKLARIEIADSKQQNMCKELNSILQFVEQLSQVDIEGVAPLTSVVATPSPLRADEVTDGNRAGEIVANAPKTTDDFFLVPKVVE